MPKHEVIRDDSGRLVVVDRLTGSREVIDGIGPSTMLEAVSVVIEVGDDPDISSRHQYAPLD